MKRKLKQKIGQALIVITFHIGMSAMLLYGFMTATTLNQKGIENMDEKEREEKLYVKLPILIREIILSSTIPLPTNIELVIREVEEIKKITNTECESALSYLKDLGIT